MQISDTTDLQGLLQDINFRCDTDSSRYLDKDKIRNLNVEYGKVWEYYTRKSKKVKPADTANKTAPYGFSEYNLVSGTAEITITEPYKFESAEVVDETGTIWRDLELIQREQVYNAIQEFQDTPSIPRYITIDGDSATLYPTPNYNATNGLRIYAQEAPTLFDVSATTETPELPIFAHSLLSIGASITYCVKNKPNRVSALKLEYNELWEQLGDYLSDRDNSKRRLSAGHRRSGI